MINLSRRRFIQTSAASLALAGARFEAKGAGSARVSRAGNLVRAVGDNYDWEWSGENDRFRFMDKKGRVMVEGKLQPAVLVQPAGQQGVRQCISGKPATWEIKEDRLTVAYERVNSSAKLSVGWRFEGQGAWLEPVTYETSAPEDVVSLHYFAEGAGGNPRPTLENNYLVHPGITESSAMSPLIPADMGLNMTSWLGHGSFPGPGLTQQWALPAGFFCGFHRNSPDNFKGAMKELLSDAYCCGLAELPNGDLFFETASGKHSPIVAFRSDLWGHLRGPGRFVLGSKWYWTVGPNYYEAIRQYYRGLVNAGIITRKSNSAQKQAVVVSPQFNTWGAEVAAGKEWGRFDEALLTSVYNGLKASGMKPGMFVIDAKWEGKYGRLEHSAERFPHFEDVLSRIRSDDHRLGMWAAFLRCEDPAELGLTPEDMMQSRDGKPLVLGEGSSHYYLFDVTQPKVEEVLRQLARKFIQRYHPDLVKFDFGYELPALDAGRPKDMNWAGERLLQKGLEVVVKAMREEKPDLVVMYYSLSPLFIDYFDLHSPDDLFLCGGDYDLAANRRFFFSSLLGEIGMATYGSGGYDWSTMPDIWFDSAPIGTLGSLNSFSADEEDARPTPDLVAKYNGLAHVLRQSSNFSIEPVDATFLGPSRAARSSSWARSENGEVVLVALRKYRLDGGLGSGKYADFLESTASVVVASKTGEGINRAPRLGVVPYGDGELIIQRRDQRQAKSRVTEHWFGGNVRQSELLIEAGKVSLTLKERAADNTPIEWVELEIEHA
jgi:hypothetical protein